MDAKDIKAALKSAREAIRAKDYKEALKHCKAILKTDKNNYNALVFVGVAAEGMEQADQAVMAYKKAVEIAPDNVLAWQGLCGFYEKSNNAAQKDDLINVYIQLQRINESDKDKWIDISEKLGALYVEKGRLDEAGQVYTELLNVVEPANRAAILDLMVTTLEKMENLTEKHQAKLLEAYEELAGSQSSTEEVWTNYLKLLKKTSQEKVKIHKAAFKCSEVHPSLVLAWELLARIYLDDCALDPCSEVALLNSTLEKLHSLDAGNGYGKLLLGFKEYRSGHYSTAREVLSTGLEKLKASVSGWLCLAQCEIKLHSNHQAYDRASQGLALISKPNITFYGDRHAAENMLKWCQIQAGVEMGVTLLDKVENLVSELSEEGFRPEELRHVQAQLLLKRDSPEAAFKMVQQWSGSDVSPRTLVLRGMCEVAMGNTDAALASLREALAVDDQSYLAHYHLGLLLYKTHTEGSAELGPCQSHLLQAAKQDPFYSPTFLCLGRYYEVIMKDLSKACRCYQKSYDLDPANEEAGASLTDALMTAGEKDKAVAVLKSATGKASAGSMKWAWLRLGLHQMRHGDPSSSIISLQSALRADPKDVHCWECLGEAYSTRGSHTAALKAFTRATELDPSAMFCYYQLATIKQALGLHDDAVKEYKGILEKNPSYVPALKGLGETYITQAKGALIQFFHGRAVDYCQLAVHRLTEAVTRRPDLSCLWKLLGDACTIITPVPPTKACMKIPAKLLDQSESTKTVDKTEILTTGARCYGMALKLQPDCGSLWQDLGVNYYHQSKMADRIKVNVLIGKAVQCLQKAVRLDPNNHKHWNALGVMAAGRLVNHPGLAQHCFIKSVQAEAKNVSAWTNLGVLYLHQDQVKSAHEAFKVAQSLEPSYVACWIGQALIAETVGDEEAMDLFRHTTELGNHVEGAVGYGHWVCRMLQDEKHRKSSLFHYAIHQMGAVPAASDALAKYLDRKPDDAVAYNLYGLLLERQGLYKPAAEALQKAIHFFDKKSDAQNLEKSRINYARVLCLSGQPEKSVAEYKKLRTLDTLDTVSGYALALYKAGDYHSSVSAYEQALSLAEEDADKSHIHAALGMVAYCIGDLAKAKSSLFDGFRLSQPSVPGLQALLSIGLLQQDTTLSGAVLEELCKLGDLGVEFSTKVEGLAAEVQAAAGSEEIGRRNLQKAMHENPLQPLLWGKLGRYLMNTSARYRAAMACARKEEVLTDKNTGTSLHQVMGSLGAGYHSTTNSDKNTLRLAQKAVHREPHTLGGWYALLAALSAHTQLSTSEALQNLMFSLTTHLMGRVESLLSGSSGNKKRHQALHLWCVKQYIVTLMKAGRTQQAKQFLQQAVWLYEKDVHLQGLTAVFNQNFAGLKNLAPGDPSGFVYQLLVSLYVVHGLTQEVERTFHQWMETTKNSKLVCLARLGHFAFQQITESEGNKEKWEGVFKDACSMVLQMDPTCAAMLLMQGVVSLADTKRFHFAKRSLLQAMERGALDSTPHSAKFARMRLLRAYELRGDEDAVKKLLQQSDETTEGCQDP